MHDVGLQVCGARLKLPERTGSAPLAVPTSDAGRARGVRPHGPAPSSAAMRGAGRDRADGRGTTARCAETPASSRRAGQSRAHNRRDRRAAQQPQPALGRLPRRVHVEQQRDDLGFGIGVDAPVLAVAHAAHRQHRRPAAEVDRRICPPIARPSSGPVSAATSPPKTGPYLEALDRIAAGAADQREIGDDRGERVAADEILDDDEIERVALERRGVAGGRDRAWPEAQPPSEFPRYCNNRIVGSGRKFGASHGGVDAGLGRRAN